ncbi:MAG: response regulator [Desulfohalobiaceae bacterium]|nr:response regulator [Desulfohalobiaceae bacterium]
MDNNQDRILVVDDEEHLQVMLRNMLEIDGYSCMVASNAEEARGYLKDYQFELIICDQKMPGESGIDLIRYISREYEDTAVIMITGEDDRELAETALEIGAYGYVIKPYRLNELLINVSNALQRQRLEIQQKQYREDLENKVAERTAQLQSTMTGVIKAMSLAVESRDPYTAGHQQRVAALALAIASEMGLDNGQAGGIHMAGIVHDLGKLSIPAEILSKPTRLTDLEFALIKCHAENGYQILKDIEFPWPIARMVLQHHERLDGSGYPHGLTRGDILLESSILAVADVVEAMASHRPYRPGRGLDLALEEVSRNKGLKFEQDVVDVCLKLFHEKKFQFDD